MKIVIMGAGGTGGYYGAHLAQAGNDVTFIARGAHLAAMRRDGLRLHGSRGTIHIDPTQATDQPADISGPVDVVLFCVKLYDTESVAELIRPLIGPDSMVISVQNGVDGPERIAKVLGAGHVLGGAAYMSARIDQPGVVSYTSAMSKLVFGELDGTRSERAQHFQAVCNQAGFTTELSDDITQTLWTKFALLAAHASLTSLTRQPLGYVYGDPDMRPVARAAIEEIAAIAKAKQIGLPDDIVERTLALADTLPATMTTSMHHDLNAGKPMENASLSGLIVRLGRELGIPTPVHQVAFAALKPFQDGTD